MKLGIATIALVALAMTMFTSSDAEGWFHSGPDVNLEVWGSSVSVDVDPNTSATTTIQNTLGKGKRGFVHFDSSVIYQQLGPYEGCSLFGADATATWAAIYRDGSVLTGSGSGHVCYDGTVFTGTVAGAITGTVGRFEGVTGSFEADASVLNSAFTGTLTGDFD